MKKPHTFFVLLLLATGATSAMQQPLITREQPIEQIRNSNGDVIIEIYDKSLEPRSDEEQIAEIFTQIYETTQAKDQREV